VGGLIDIAIRVAINAVAFVVAASLVPGAEFRSESEPWKIVVVALIFGIVNAYLRPILRLLSMPLNLVTLGGVGFVINIAMVLLTAAVSGELRLGFRLGGWPRTDFNLETIVAALGIAVIVSLVATALSLVRTLTPRV
jgi:putative membrane protein